MGVSVCVWCSSHIDVPIHIRNTAADTHDCTLCLRWGAKTPTAWSISSPTRSCQASVTIRCNSHCGGTVPVHDPIRRDRRTFLEGVTICRHSPLHFHSKHIPFRAILKFSFCIPIPSAFPKRSACEPHWSYLGAVAQAHNRRTQCATQSPNCVSIICGCAMAPALMLPLL
jgi:hypothetical protein